MLLASTTGSKAANAAWFSPSVTLPFPQDTVRREAGTIAVSFSTASTITNAQFQVTFDGGTTWQTIGTGVAPAANAVYEVTFSITKNQSFNVRQRQAQSLLISQMCFSLTD